MRQGVAQDLPVGEVGRPDHLDVAGGGVGGVGEVGGPDPDDVRVGEVKGKTGPPVPPPCTDWQLPATPDNEVTAPLWLPTEIWLRARSTPPRQVSRAVMAPCCADRLVVAVARLVLAPDSCHVASSRPPAGSPAAPRWWSAWPGPSPARAGSPTAAPGRQRATPGPGGALSARQDPMPPPRREGTAPRHRRAPLPGAWATAAAGGSRRGRAPAVRGRADQGRRATSRRRRRTRLRRPGARHRHPRR